MRNVHYFIKLLWITVFSLSSLGAETLRIDEARNVAAIIVDVPRDWIKNQIVRENGIIYTFRRGNAEMEIRSFLFSDVNMDYIIHAKAARLFARYSHVNILLEKEEVSGDFKKQTIFWKLRYQGQTFFEKTVIQQFQNNIVILSCLAAENDYPHNRVVFENAILSLRYDNTEFSEYLENLDNQKETDKDKIEITKDLINEMNSLYDEQENKKPEKIKKVR